MCLKGLIHWNKISDSIGIINRREEQQLLHEVLSRFRRRPLVFEIPPIGDKENRRHQILFLTSKLQTFENPGKGRMFDIKTYISKYLN